MDGARIDSISPCTVQWGDRILIHGSGFGLEMGRVVIGGEVTEGIYHWSDTVIDARVPSRTPAGDVLVEVFPPGPSKPLSPPYHPMPGEPTPEPTPTPGPTWYAAGGPLHVLNFLLPGHPDSFVPGVVIVRVRPGLDPALLAERHGLPSPRPLLPTTTSPELARYHVFSVEEGREACWVVELAEDPDVEWAEPEGRGYALS